MNTSYFCETQYRLLFSDFFVSIDGLDRFLKYLEIYLLTLHPRVEQSGNMKQQSAEFLKKIQRTITRPNFHLHSHKGRSLERQRLVYSGTSFLMSPNPISFQRRKQTQNRLRKYVHSQVPLYTTQNVCGKNTSSNPTKTQNISFV